MVNVKEGNCHLEGSFIGCLAEIGLALKDWLDVAESRGMNKELELAKFILATCSASHFNVDKVIACAVVMQMEKNPDKETTFDDLMKDFNEKESKNG